METETESVKIPKKTMNRLRKYISKTTEGRVYGRIGETIDLALNEYLDKQEKTKKSQDRKQ